MDNNNLKKAQEWFLAWQEAFKGKDEMEAAYYVVGQLLCYCTDLESRIKELERKVAMKVDNIIYGPSLQDFVQIKGPRTIETNKSPENGK